MSKIFNSLYEDMDKVMKKQWMKQGNLGGLANKYGWLL